MFFVSARYAKVWKIFPAKERSCGMSIGTSDKQQDGKYENSRWPAMAVGHALEQVNKGNIKEGEQYAIIKGKVKNVPYKDDNGNWHERLSLIVSEFAPAGSTESKSTSTKSSNKKPDPTPDVDTESDPW